MLLQWLQANGATSDAVPDAWREFLLALTGLPAEDYHRNDYWWAYLDGLVPAGVGRNLSDMERWFWDPAGGGGVIGDLVNAGGPYSGFEKAAIQLNGTVIFVDDPSPTILWTIESGGTGVFSDASITNPTFTPDLPGDYVLRLTGTGVPAGALFDLTNLTSVERQHVTFTGNFAPFDLTVDVPITPRDVSPSYEGDWTPFVYTLTGTAWPAWASIDPNTGIITGTPDTVELTTGHTVTATDTDANTAVSNTFDINVVADSVPVEFTGNIADIVGEVGVAITPIQAWQEFNGTETPITFTSQGTALPAGLTLSSAGVISGTPTVEATTAGHIVRATDANLDTADSNAFGAEITEVVADVPIFAVALQSTAVPEIATGSDVFTFARSSEATFVDWEGIVRTALDDELRFRGARRVENYGDNDYTNWEVAASATIDAAGVVAFPGVSSAEYVRQRTTIPNFTGTKAVFSMEIKALDGPSVGKELRLRCQGSGPTFNTYAGADAALTSDWVRFSTPLLDIVDDVSSGVRWQLWVNTPPSGAVSCQIRNVQIERVDGQAIEAPSEFVDETVDHGAGVLGVKYFITKNGNTVDVNGVVTEATGAAIGASDFYADVDGPWGYREEDGGDNLLTYSEQFNNVAWTKSNLAAIGTDAATAADGTLTADKITPSAVAAFNFIGQVSSALTATEEYTQTFFVEPAGYDWVQLAGSTNFTATAYANFNVTTGALGNSSGFTNIDSELIGNGIYRITVTDTAAASSGGRILFSVIESDVAQRLPSWTANGTSGVYLWGGMLEPGDFPSSYIKTEATIVSRSKDVLTYDEVNNWNLSEGTVVCEATTDWGNNPYNAAAVAVGGVSGARHLMVVSGGGNTRIDSNMGSTANASGGTDMRLGPVRIAHTYKAALHRVYQGPVEGSQVAFTPNVGGNIGVGNQGNGANPWGGGTIRFLKIYDVELAQGDLP
jgi:hypothetical protein